jgi:hypothetical protein
MEKAAYVQTLEQAADIAGGYAELAAVLGVSQNDLDAWTKGTSVPGPALFLRVVDLVLGDLQRRLNPQETE